MAKFKLVIEAEIGLTEEARKAWAKFSDLEKAEYFEVIPKTIREAIIWELESEAHVVNSLDIKYTEVSE